MIGMSPHRIGAGSHRELYYAGPHIYDAILSTLSEFFPLANTPSLTPLP